MYHWINDEKFLKDLRRECGDLINRLKNNINNGDYIRIDTQLVGSGAKDIETQNANEPVDLDYNVDVLQILSGSSKEVNIKEYIRKEFNKVLKDKCWGDCSDSTSALQTLLQQFKTGNKTKFSVDLGIVKEANGTWYRMKHEKTGNTHTDKWYWNEGPNSKGLTDKVNWLKKKGCWKETKDAYLDKKNMYLKRNDHNHPSFNCYIEAVNEVYGAYTNPNGHKNIKKVQKQPQQVKNKIVNASLNMKYNDDAHKTFYFSYKFDGKEVKSPVYNNNTSVEDDYKLAMHWLNTLTTAVTKDKNVTKLIVETSPYIYSMIVENKLGNRTMTAEERNLIRGYLGRIKRLGIAVTAKQMKE